MVKAVKFVSLFHGTGKRNLTRNGECDACVCVRERREGSDCNGGTHFDCGEGIFQEQGVTRLISTPEFLERDAVAGRFELWSSGRYEREVRQNVTWNVFLQRMEIELRRVRLLATYI